MYSLAQQQPTSVFKKEKRGRNKSPSTFLQGFKGWEMKLTCPAAQDRGRPHSERDEGFHLQTGSFTSISDNSVVIRPLNPHWALGGGAVPAPPSLGTFITRPVPPQGTLRAAVPAPPSLSTFVTRPLNPYWALKAEQAQLHHLQDGPAPPSPSTFVTQPLPLEHLCNAASPPHGALRAAAAPGSVPHAARLQGSEGLRKVHQHLLA